MPSPPIRVAEGLEIGRGRPLAVIAGPDVIESEPHALKMAAALKQICSDRGVPFVYKSSFDKANRTSADSYRGPGLDEGLRILSRVRREVGVPVTTDFHEPGQAAPAAEVVDLLQVPAFLCRQTDMIAAACRTGRAVNVKKGQFLAPGDARHILNKAQAAGAATVMITERGTTFGYHNLVVDFRSLAILGRLGVPVCFDATHSVQLPGGAGGASGGERAHIPILARAAVAVGVDALFFEVHDDPDHALCDGPSQWPLEAFGSLLDSLLVLDEASRRARR